MTILKYDLEISGFGSAALGHVCLLNLKDQTYPGSEGTKTEGWPSWTVPVMRWAKQQGGITGYPHSALHVDPRGGAAWSMQWLDSDGDGMLDVREAAGGILPTKVEEIDSNDDGRLSQGELEAAYDRAADQLPNYAIPGLNGGGAMEIFVSTAEGVCDFISAMDTARIPEWNTWYHLLNCGFPLKLSGETDFPCMSSRRVGQGRVYAQLGKVDQIDFESWCQRVASGQSYVSDGFAHALDFRIQDQRAGEQDVRLEGPEDILVSATVSFAPSQPHAVAYGTLQPPAGRRMVGDTVNLHAPRDTGIKQGGRRLVELVVNGQVAAKQLIPADGNVHDIKFEVPIERSSWVALREFPQMHTNPINVIVAGQPIRCSRKSALWCADSVRRLWANRRRFIKEPERAEAQKAYQRAIAEYLRRAEQSPDDGSHLAITELPE